MTFLGWHFGREFLVKHILLPGCLGSMMIARMAPARRHDDVHQLIFYAGGMANIFAQRYDLSKIRIGKTIWIHIPGDPIYRSLFTIFILIGSENLIPNV